MPFVETSSGRVHYVERGSGPVVLLLHATLHDHHDFDRVAERLARAYRTIALDWPGHGGSDTPVGTSATGFARVLAEVFDKLGLEHVVLIGNSVGGFAAVRLALDRPDLVAGLVLVNSGGFSAVTPVARLMCRLLGTPWITRLLLPLLVPGYMKERNEDDRGIAERAVARARTREGARVAAGLWRSFTATDWDMRSEGRQLRAPVLLVWGGRDTILPMRAARQTHEAIPQAQLHVFDTGHVVFASDTDGFMEVVEPFLALRSIA